MAERKVQDRLAMGSGLAVRRNGERGGKRRGQAAMRINDLLLVAYRCSMSGPSSAQDLERTLLLVSELPHKLVD